MASSVPRTSVIPQSDTTHAGSQPSILPQPLSRLRACDHLPEWKRQLSNHDSQVLSEKQALRPQEDGRMSLLRQQPGLAGDEPLFRQEGTTGWSFSLGCLWICCI